MIAGNHRHIERLASGAAHWALGSASDSRSVPQQPFALALFEPGPLAVTPDIFSLGHHEMIVVDSIRDAATHAEAHPIKLIIAIQPLQAQPAQLTSAWMHAELRAFSTIEALLRESAPVRRAVVANEMRIVAALLEHPSERVHWAGEHPEIDLILRDP